MEGNRKWCGQIYPDPILRRKRHLGKDWSTSIKGETTHGCVLHMSKSESVYSGT